MIGKLSPFSHSNLQMVNKQTIKEGSISLAGVQVETGFMIGGQESSSRIK